MPDFETRIKALETAHQELQDAFIVMTHLETKMSRMVKEQAEYMAGHEARLKQAELQSAEQRQLNSEVDKRIADLVSAVGALISQQRRQ